MSIVDEFERSRDGNVSGWLNGGVKCCGLVCIASILACFIHLLVYLASGMAGMGETAIYAIVILASGVGFVVGNVIRFAMELVECWMDEEDDE